jgi:AcrR family transcriptional regulator
MTRTGEPTTVTSEAVLDVALTLSADRGYHGTALSQIAEALELRIPRASTTTRSPSTASC